MIGKGGMGEIYAAGIAAAGAVTEVARLSGELLFGGRTTTDGKLIISRGTAVTDVVFISAAAKSVQ